LDRAGTGFHILIDEVTFDGIASTGSPSAPEPATLGMVGIMLVLAMVWPVLSQPSQSRQSCT
jgi:hypothetical protein